MLKNKLLLITEIMLFIIVTIVIIMASMFMEPLQPLKITLQIMLPFFLIAYFFLWLTYRILNFYHGQILQQKDVLEKLNKAFIALSVSIKIDALLKKSLEIMIDFCKGSRGVLLVVDDKLLKYSSGEVLTLNLSHSGKYSNANNYSLLTFSPCDIPENVEDRIKQLLKDFDFEKSRSITVIPISGKGHIKTVAIVGAKLSKKEARNVFSEIKNVMDIFIRQLNIELENTLLHEEINEASITDPLTKLFNRRYFNMRLKEELVKAQRSGFPVSVIISDLDNFKYYVDTYGHPMGDIILAEVASVVKSSIRESDMACRFGGDEFVYLLPFASSVEAEALAQRIKHNVSSFAFLKEAVDADVHITLSMGIASFPEHGQNEQEIISKADHALFASKNMGKDRIVVYSENIN